MPARTIHSSRSAHLTYCPRADWYGVGNRSRWGWYATAWSVFRTTGVAQVRVLGLTLTLVL